MNDEDTKRASAGFTTALNGSRTWRQECFKAEARPAADMVAKRTSLDSMIGFGKLTIAPAQALCVDMAGAKINSGESPGVVECGELATSVFPKLSLTPMPTPCSPTERQADEARRFVESVPTKSTKKSWLARVAAETEKLVALSNPREPTRVQAYVVTACTSNGKDYYANRDDSSRGGGAAMSYRCELLVFWLDPAGAVKAYARGEGAESTYGAQIETSDTLGAKNDEARRRAIQSASADLLGSVERRLGL